MNHIEINKDDFMKALDIYENWRNLNEIIQNNFPFKRKVNIPEAFTEVVCCYVNEFKLAVKGGSEDGICKKSGNLIQVKATANWNSDLTSFGPTSQFDELHFLRLNQETEKLYLYKTPIEELYDTKVNKKETMKEQQEQGRRPRFSIIDKFIKKENIEPYAIVDLKTRTIS